MHVFDGSGPGRLHVGRVGTIRLNHGVITEPFLGGIYCDDAKAQTHYCGA